MMNYSGKDIRGQSFKDDNFEGIKFTGTDIRGTNFQRANLQGANFSGAKAGLQKRWTIVLLLISCLVGGIFGFFSALNSYLVLIIFTFQVEQDQVDSKLILIIVTLIVGIIIHQRIIAYSKRRAFDFILALVVGILTVFAFTEARAVAVPFFGTVTLAFMLAELFAFAGAFVFAGAKAVVGDFAGFIFFAVAVTIGVVTAEYFAAARAGAFAEPFGRAFIGILVLLSIYISHQAMNGSKQYALVRSAAIAFGSFGSTSFKGANLTDTNFSGATLKNTDFRGANLTRTCFQNANKLDTVRPGLTYLKESKLRQIILTRLGKDLNFDTQDLQGVNFQGVKLNNTSFIGTNLSDANLQDADLSGAKLVRTQLDGTNFTGATLTGACIENWNITKFTNLNNVICEYIYLETNEKEKRPSNGNFLPGQFTVIFQKVLETVDLIFADSIDWKAFLMSFERLKERYGENNLSVQAIEKKSSNTYLIRVEVPSEANKEEIEGNAKIFYEQERKAPKENYRNQLQNNKLNTLLEEMIYSIVIKNIINVQTTSESKSMSESKKESNYNLPNAQFAGGLVDAETVNADQIGGNITNYQSEQKQNLAQAAADIQQLLKQLEKTNPTATETEKIEHINNETTPNFKRRAAGALQASGEAAIDEFILENKYLKVVKAAVKGWLNPGS